MPTDQFAERIKFRRAANGLSQTELAEKMEVSQPLISQWELGRQKPSSKQIERLDEILGDLIALPAVSADGEGTTPVGAWLSRARLKRNLTVNELAARASVSAATIYNLETGRAQNPHPRTIKSLEGALNERLESEQQLKEAGEIKGLGEFVDFDPYDLNNLPKTPGVYVFYDISKRPIYVGQGGSIARRIKDHHDKFWFKRPIVEDAAYVEIGDEKLREQVETILIRFLKSNAVINKNKVDRE